MNRKKTSAGGIVFIMLLAASYCFSINLSGFNVPNGKTIAISDATISTTGSVTIAGTATFKATSIFLEPGFSAKNGSLFKATGVSTVTPNTIVANLDDFNSFEISDPRLEASCQNFSAGGAAYNFKIIGGKVYYCVNGSFVGEFSPNYTSYNTYAAGQILPMEPVDMIATDNDVVMVKAVANNADGSPRFFWGQMVLLYTNDYLKDGVPQSVNSYYTKVNPEYPTPVPNSFWPVNLDNHFGLINYNDTTKFRIQNIECGIDVTLPKDMPDLKDIVNDTAVKIMKDAMIVKVDKTMWYEIHGVPPRNGITDGSVATMANGGFENQKKKIFSDMYSDFEAILNGMVTDSVQGVLKGQMKAMIQKKAALLPRNMPWYERVAVCILTAGVSEYLGDLAQNEITYINCVIDSINFKNYVSAIKTFYTNIISTALSEEWTDTSQNSPTTLKFKSFENNFKQSIVNIVTPSCPQQSSDNITTFLNTLKGSLFTMGLGMGNFAGAGSSSFGSCGTSTGFGTLSEALLNTASSIGMSYSMVNNVTDSQSEGYWVRKYWNGLYNWNKFFKFPNTVFEMETFSPSFNPAESSYTKSRIKIKRVLDIGVGNPHRYEHYRKSNGGECQDYFGDDEFKSSNTTTPKVDMSKVKTRMFPKGMYHGEIVDGNGYNDGTTNFFMLAEINMDNSGQSQFKKAYTVLWIDEQEYFSERWRVIDLRDNAFEGAPGTFLSMFPVLCWADGENMADFQSKYWTPYFEMGANSNFEPRMATSRCGLAIAADTAIFTTSFFWATTDRTWRWRKYPTLAAGERVDKQSIRLRDDQTIVLKGKKVINGIGYEGYWFQRMLDDNNNFAGDPRAGNKPATGYTMPWQFVDSSAFRIADGDFFRMGVYAGPALSSTGYKAYHPHTHIFKIIKPLVNVAGAPIDLSDLNQNATFYSSFVNKSLVLYERVDTTSASTVTTCHPMYDKMPQSIKANLPIRMKIVVQNSDVNPYKYFLCFEDSRYDDLGIFDPVSPTSGFLSQGITPRTYVLREENNTSNCFTLGKADADHSDFEDLNIWSDSTISSVDLTCSSAGVYADFTHYPVSNRYLYTYIGAGVIENGASKVLFRIPLRYDSYDSETGKVYIPMSSPLMYSTTTWASDVAKYFSPEGRVKYGTSVWVEEAFGNGGPVQTFTAH